MTYVVDFPENIEARLHQRAETTGEDVVHLIQVAVTEFVEKNVPPTARRLPDPPLAVVETSPPFDLPRSDATPTTPDIVIDGSARLPDSLSAKA
jgi:hypothetical protein